jgi:hypothetical protein
LCECSVSGRKHRSRARRRRESFSLADGKGDAPELVDDIFLADCDDSWLLVQRSDEENKLESAAVEAKTFFRRECCCLEPTANARDAKEEARMEKIQDTRHQVGKRALQERDKRPPSAAATTGVSTATSALTANRLLVRDNDDDVQH